MRIVFCLLLALLPALGISAQSFEANFQDATLRLDYVLCGDAWHQSIYLEDTGRIPGWAGRRTQLEAPLLKGNGQIRLLDPVSSEVLYAESFSTLFQEWQSTEEATRVQRAFEACFRVPFPRRPVEVELSLSDVHGMVSSCLRHLVDPSDILIRQYKPSPAECRDIYLGGSVEEAVDILILADGYSAEEREKFFADAARARDALFTHEPFASRSASFNIRAAFLPSQESGVSIPHDSLWVNNLADSHFDTFYSARYLTTTSMRKVHDAAGANPFEHLILLCNTSCYGGGGIYNFITFMPSDHITFPQVLVHEFGHAFGGLGDEYYYDDQYSSQYPSDTEPWEPNLTTLVDFDSKWKDLIPSRKAGLYEGGGYQSKGVWRPAEDCRMKTNSCPDFCPVCTRAINRMIDFCTGQP